MKTLKHNGILVLPQYQACGYVIFINGQSYQLQSKAEEMAFAWCRKRDTPYVKDLVFCKNFFSDFCKELGITYTEEKDFNFEQIIFALETEKYHKENMTQGEKKEGVVERKKLRDERKEKYGYAEVDGNKVEISNYIAEPSSLFMGRGKHPLRGSWKEGPKEEDITLNLSPDAPRPLGNWKEIVWESKKMYVAKWIDKLSGKVKYVWLSDTWGKKQEKEKAKFDKANELEKNLNVVRHLIGTGLNSTDPKRWKIATVCYLIFNLNMRVGDEKDPDEADTVGAITLRPEHVTIVNNKVFFDFLGKDSVRWEKELECDPQAIKNLVSVIKNCKEYLFEGITSKDVTIFLQEGMKGLTAKVFRTWKISQIVKEYLGERVQVKSEPLWMKVITAKYANLQGAIVANHKRKIPDKFEESLSKKKEKLEKLQIEANEIMEKKKPFRKIAEKIQKADLELSFFKDSKEYTLGTSLKSYINPIIFKEWCDKVDLPYEKVYNKTLLKKYSWVFN